MARITNQQLFARSYAAGLEAADKMTMMADALREQKEPLPPAAVLKVRDLLRCAYCNMQELKTRLKKKGNV